MMQKIKPILIPAIIIALISGLIIVVYNLTYVDTSTVVTDKQLAAVTKIYGEGDYSVIPVSEYPEALKNGDEMEKFQFMGGYFNDNYNSCRT